MKVALVHDWLTTFGGGEQVLLALHELFPEAPIYTSIWNPERTKPFAGADIRTSYLQKLPGAKNHHQVLIPLIPQTFESFDLKEFDLIISSSTGPAKGVITQPSQRHICYMHTPPRYLWHLGGDNRTRGWLRSYVAHKLRIWDVVSASRVDTFVANSQTVAKRIQKIYRRDAEIIYPPVNTSRFIPQESAGDYFLSVSRLIQYKRVDLIIDACLQVGAKLKVVGEGPERSSLEKLAGKSSLIEFCGRVNDAELAQLYANTKAFVFAAEEDFGIVPVEAMSAGRPVIAYGKGGLTESVKEGLSGAFFKEQSVKSLVELLKSFDETNYEPKKISRHAQQFDKEVFKKKILALVKG